MQRASVSIIGNCQARAVSDYLAIMLPDIEFVVGFSRDINIGLVDLEDIIQNEVLIVQTVMLNRVKAMLSGLGINRRIIAIPTIYYTGFHPDFIYVRGPVANIQSPMHNANSAIVFAAWKAGLTAADALSLFNDRTYVALGYHDHFSIARNDLLGEAEVLGLDLRSEYSNWERSGHFMHTPNHPKPIVLAGLSRSVVSELGIEPATRFPEALLPDQLAANMIWPVYPELTKTVGGTGEYIFKPPSGKRAFGSPLTILSLEEFVEGSFRAYSEYSPEDLRSPRLSDDRYRDVIDTFRSRKGDAAKAGHPYRGLPVHHFWRKAVTSVEMAKLDPVVAPKTIITPDMKIATAGSCFAQHIARELQNSGFNYYVAESRSDVSLEEQRRLQYGLFSCRYGNLYTAAQLNQMWDRAAGDFVPKDQVWTRGDGRFVDPFRPRVEPEGFSSPEAVAADREHHFNCVRDMWKSLDVFIFTLGLTEAWRARTDGAVFPLAPGVTAGQMNFDDYEFHNYSAAETADEMCAFICKLHKVNPQAKVLLTVSPVPLEATYENRHVLVSTTYSKAALRVAAEEVAKQFSNVEYFPSYEIITGNYTRGSYYAEDLREIMPQGVSHVMAKFLDHHTRKSSNISHKPSVEFLQGQEIVCDEELLRFN